MSFLRTHLFLILLCCISTALFLVQAQLYLNDLHSAQPLRNSNDFYHYYESSRLALAVGGPYCRTLDDSANNSQKKGLIKVATNPPALVLALYPLTLLDSQTGWCVWLATLFSASWITLFLLLRFLNISIIHATLFASVFVFSGPFLSSYRFAQISPILLLLIVSSFILTKKNLEAAAAVLLGLAIALKFFLLPLVIFLWANGRRRQCVLGLISVAVFTVIPELASEASIKDWVKCAVPFIDTYSNDSTFNQSLLGIVVNLSRSLTISKAGPYAYLLQVLGSLKTVTMLFVFVFAYLIGASLQGRTVLFPWGFSTVLALSIIFLPFAWAHYFVILLLPICIYLYGIKDRTLRFILTILFFTCLPLTPFKFVIDLNEQTTLAEHFFSRLLTFCPTLLFFALLAFAARRSYTEQRLLVPTDD